MARDILRRLAAKQLTKAAKAAGDVVAAQVSKTIGQGKGLREVGSLHEPGVGLPKQDVSDLLHDLYASAPDYSKGDMAAEAHALAKQMRVYNELEKHMPAPIDIEWTAPYYEGRLGDPINKNAIENMATWLSVLSRMPKELFKRAGRVRLYYHRPPNLPEGTVASFFPYPVGDNRRHIAVPDIARQNLREAQNYAVWALAHEAGHSLVDDPQLYDKVLDFLEQAQWRFPAKKTSGEPLSELGYATTAVRGAQPDLYTWKTGRAYAPADYEELSRAFSPLWPEEGRPLERPPGVWGESPYERWLSELYAETHPTEDLAESVAARVLKSRPELLRGLPDAVRREPMARALALRKNVRYEPITELLEAAGVPLAWLLYLLQRRYGQADGNQGGRERL